ncbi:hypothetical protein OV090_45420 [Nannocystis sp. RBIL2]|uniref:hypothetical protein n=1 Tax=Nannocystis sp. RBIL2 TaxID=2996788 RepID=UPI002270AD40|nr:hypothetical protein [Nannocystis sp. RBIL2]MCY1072071.1 hypothetical protein [Nannocystis sp. RBIL2]
MFEPDGRPGQQRTMPFAAIAGLALTADGRRLAAVGGEVSPDSDAQPRIFDLPELSGESAMPKVGDEAKLRWSGDGRWLVSAAEKKTPYVFAVLACEPGKARPSWRGTGNAVAVRGNQIVTWTQTQTTRAEIALWNPEQKQPVRSASLKTPIGGKDCSVAVIQGGSHLVVRTQAISIIDLATLELVASFDYSFSGTSPRLDASPDGRYLLLNFAVQDRLWVVDSQSLLP